MNQLYIRQALQESTDQLGVIKNVDKGYGFPSYTALPAVVPAKYSAPIPNPYPFNLSYGEEAADVARLEDRERRPDLREPGYRCDASAARASPRATR